MRRLLSTLVTTALVGTGLVGLAAPAHAATPALRIADLKVTETEATQVRTVTITRSAPTTTKVTVKVASANGTATAPADYAAVPLTTVTFLAGQTTKTVAVQVKGDALDEADETFSLKLSAPVGATLADALGVVTVVDNDAAPALSIAPQTLAEGNSGFVDRTVALSLSAPSGRTVTVGWQLMNGTAVSGEDFEPGSGSVVFPPGSTSQPLTVSLVGDTVDEATERFYVLLGPSTNATIPNPYGRVFISADDTPASPQLFRFVPATGSAASVVLKGTAPAGQLVQVIADGSCSGGVVVNVTSAELAAGVELAASDNAVSTWSARTVSNATMLTSPCSNSVSYTHDDVAPEAPSPYFLQPAANDNTPEVLGSSDSGTTVRLFKDACVSSPLAKATSATFASTGVIGSVPDDSVTSFWVDAVDAAGNRSACRAVGDYTEDSTAPGPVQLLSFSSSGVGSQPYAALGTEGDATVLVYKTDSLFSFCGDLVTEVPASAFGNGTGRIPFDAGANLTSYRILLPKDAVGNVGDCLTYGVQLAYTDTATEVEPNDTTGTANGPVPAGTSHLYGELPSSADKDVLAVQVPASGTLVAETFDVPDNPTCTSNDLDTFIRIYNPVGALLGGNDDSGPGFCSALTLTGLSAGTYFVEVGMSSFAGSVPYPLSYDLKVQSFVPSAPTTTAETEVNDTLGAANAIGAFTTATPRDATGTITTNSDIDYFSFTSDGSTMTVETLDGSGPATCAANTEDTKIDVVDGAGTLLAADDDNGVGFCSKTTLTPPGAGTYYVKVYRSPLAGGGSQAPFAYRLRVS